jgi:hypothetical protein
MMLRNIVVSNCENYINVFFDPLLCHFANIVSLWLFTFEVEAPYVAKRKFIFSI